MTWITRQDMFDLLNELIQAHPAKYATLTEIKTHIEDLEKVERNYRWVVDSLERHGYPLAQEYGFNVTGTVENLAASNLAVRSLTAEAGLIQDDDVKTDVVPLLRMFLPV